MQIIRFIRILLDHVSSNYWTYQSNVFSFSWKLFAENRLVKSFIIQPEISTHYCIICLCSIDIWNNTSVSFEFLELFWNMFNTKTIKICFRIVPTTISNTLISNTIIFIKIYYICSILYKSRTCLNCRLSLE